MPFSVFYALHTTLSINYKKYIEKTARIRKLKAKDLIKRPGESKKAIYFVVSGLLQTYTVDDRNRKRIIDFTWETQTCASTSGTYLIAPNEDYIQCIEDTVIIQFSMEMAANIIKNYKEGIAFCRSMMVINNKKYDTHLRLMQIKDRDKRVDQFQKAFKRCIFRLSIDHQADYLGMHRSTFLASQKANLRNKMK